MSRPHRPAEVVWDLLSGGEGYEHEWQDLTLTRDRWLNAVVRCRALRRNGDWGQAIASLLSADSLGRAVGNRSRPPAAVLQSFTDGHAWVHRSDDLAVWRDLWRLADAEWRNMTWLVHRLRFAADRADAYLHVPPDPQPLDPRREAMVLVLTEYEALWPKPRSPKDGADYGTPTQPPLPLEDHVRRAHNLLVATVPDWMRETTDPEGRDPLTAPNAGKKIRQNLGGYEGIQGRARHLAATRAPLSPLAQRYGHGEVPTVDASGRRARLLGLASCAPQPDVYARAHLEIQDLLDEQQPSSLAGAVSGEQLASLALAAIEGLELQRLAGVRPDTLPPPEEVLRILLLGHRELALHIERQGKSAVGSARADGNQQGERT